jgi:integrase
LTRRVARVRGEAVGAGKTTAARRDVPLSNKAIHLIMQLPQDRLFAMSDNVLTSCFHYAKAGIPDLHFHDTRHEAITRLSRKLDVLPLARIVGHKDLKQLMTYYNETAENLAKLLD